MLSSAQRWVDVAFSEPIAEQSFTPADVKLRGPRPDGQVDDIQVLSVTRLDDTHYRLSFVPQYVNGTYTLQIGPNVLDLAGNAMDQNRDSVPGQDPEDRYEGTFQVHRQPLRIVAQQPTGLVLGGIDTIDVTFSAPIAPVVFLPPTW